MLRPGGYLAADESTCTIQGLRLPASKIASARAGSAILLAPCWILSLHRPAWHAGKGLGLADITADSVLEAVAEFDRLGRDAFLDFYGFKPAKEYFLILDGRWYDSKAICGAAHGYARTDLRALRSDEFSGGSRTVQRRLEELGFRVERLPGGTGHEPVGNTKRNPVWDESELILALALYLRSGPGSSTDPQVIELSELLDRLPSHSRQPDAARLRNPEDVASKLGNFAALDPGVIGTDMKLGGEREKKIWVTFAGSEDLLVEAAARIRDGREWNELLAPAVDQPMVVPVSIEAHHTHIFEFQRNAGAGQGFRHEQALVHAYNEHLKSMGHETIRHSYPRAGTGSPLFCDLVDETAKVLYEAKSNTRRESIRMALGQLYDYRRFEPKTMAMAVLLPRKPGDDLIKYLASAQIGVVWQTHEGFDSTGL